MLLADWARPGTVRSMKTSHFAQNFVAEISDAVDKCSDGYVVGGMEGLSLRPATSRDREFLFELHRAAMGPYIEQLYGPWDDAVQWDFFDRWFQPKNVLVITVEGEDVGVLGLEDRDDEVYVTRIEVHPDWQNRGIGAAAMRDVLQKANKEGRAVALHVFEINPARRLYQSLGFVALDQHEGRILMKATPK